jgi:hypothetical protein
MPIPLCTLSFVEKGRALFSSRCSKLPSRTRTVHCCLKIALLEPSCHWKNNKDTEADVDDDDEEDVTKYKVGDAVRTINGLVSSAVAVNVQSGTYDIKHRNKGDVDENVHPKFFKPYAPPTRKRTAESKTWDYREEPVESMQEYIARTGVSAEFNVLPPDVKRRRG